MPVTCSVAASILSTESHVEYTTDLRAVEQPGINLCLWHRQSEAAVAAELRDLNARDLPDVRCTVTQATAEDTLDQLLQTNGLHPAAFPAWRGDLLELIHRFLPLCRGPQALLRLETTRDDGCTRFHVDRTHLRLLCTYQGPGTEWLGNAQVDRAALAQGRANTDIIRHGSVRAFPVFAVGIMKGSRYPGNEDNGLVHRSPPMSGRDDVRVLVCLDG